MIREILNVKGRGRDGDKNVAMKKGRLRFKKKCNKER